MARFFVVCLLITLRCQNDVPARSDEILAIVRTANEEHVTDCASGRMKFRKQSNGEDGKKKFEVAGTIEWAEDYMYFDGTYIRQWNGESDGEYEINEDVKLKFLRHGNQAICWSQLKQETEPGGVSHIVRLFPWDKLVKTPFVPILPDPSAYLNSRNSMIRGGTSLTLLQLDPVTMQGIEYERAVTVDGQRVGVAGYFKPGVRHTAVHDIAQGCLCVETLDEYEYMTPNRIDSAKRELAQRPDGVWYPKTVTYESRVAGVVRQVGTLEIFEFETLEKRIKSRPVSLNAFGKLPKGASIHEMNRKGKNRSYTLGNDGTNPPSLEEKLLQQAESIRKRKKMEEMN